MQSSRQLRTRKPKQKDSLEKVMETIETDETQDKKSEPPTKKQKGDHSQKSPTKISQLQTTKEKTPSSIYSDE